jgi:hypothetical protein
MNAIAEATILNALAFSAPMIGVLLSAWSFRWAERGATPDRPFGSYGNDLEPENIMLLAGERSRARRWARVLFNTGALSLAAAVPLGNAGNHVTDSFNWLALSGLLILVAAGIYACREIIGIWKNLQSDAFGLYFDKDMYRLYDQKKVRKLYFALNPLPIWSIFDPSWHSKIQEPDINDVVRVASKSTYP